MQAHVFRRAFGDQQATGVAAFGAEVDQPVAGTDDVEVVFNDDERVAVFQQAAHGAHEFGDVVKVQARGGLVEQEQHAFFGERLFAGCFGFGSFGQEAS